MNNLCNVYVLYVCTVNMFVEISTSTRINLCKCSTCSCILLIGLQLYTYISTLHIHLCERRSVYRYMQTAQFLQNKKSNNSKSISRLLFRSLDSKPFQSS